MRGDYNFSVSSNILDAKYEMLNFQKVVAPSVRRALNRALLSMRAEAVKVIKKKIALKPDVIRKDFTKIQSATFTRFSGSVDFSNDSIPMRRFIIGYKGITSQKGKTINQRRTLKAMVVPGKTIVLRKMFIQKVRTTQVFNRLRTDRFRKQGVRSIGSIVTNPRNLIVKNMEAKGVATFEKVFAHEINYRTTIKK